jgi:hypothetical protein
VPPGATLRRGYHGTVSAGAEAGRRVQQGVPRVHAGRVLLRRLGGKQLRPDQLLEVIQGALPGRVQLYPRDDQTSTFTCPAGTNYKVFFCGSALEAKR